jgi:hypothetical protein
MAFLASQLQITAAFNAVTKRFTITDTTDYSGVVKSNVLGTVGVTINNGTNFYPSTQVISTVNGTSAALASAPWTASPIFLTGLYSFTYTAKIVAMLQSYTVVSNTANSLSIQGDYAAQINDATATAFKYNATSITLPASPATYNSTTGLTVVAVTTSLPVIIGNQFNFTVDQSYTNLIEQEVSYIQPSVCLSWITDLCCSSMTVADVTIYPATTTVTTRLHTISYPDGMLIPQADITSPTISKTITPIWTGTWTDVFTSSFTTTYGIATVSDTIRGVKNHLVSSDEGLCQIYSCITNMANKYAAYLTSAPQRALEMQKYISQASAAYMAYMIGKQCGEADYEQNLTIITDIANSCGCGCDCADCADGTPQQVVGCCVDSGSSLNTIVIQSDLAGSMTITGVPSGGTTTFTIGVSGAWFSSQFNTLFAAKSINALSDVDTTGVPAANQVLYWNNTTQQWTRSKLNLSQLGDVNITGLANDYILYYDLATTSFKFKANPVPTVSIATCTDVVLTSVANKDVLSWNSGTSKWINLSNTLDNLQNVNTTGKITNSSIKWNGTNWIPYNAVQALDDLSDVTITSLANNDRFQYVIGTGWQNRPLPTFTGGYTPLGGFTYALGGYDSFFASFDPITSNLKLGGVIGSATTVLASTPIAILAGVTPIPTRRLFPIVILTPGGVYLNGIASIESVGQTINIMSHVNATGTTVSGAPIGTYFFDGVLLTAQ